jgi:hypothetical protein
MWIVSHNQCDFGDTSYLTLTNSWHYCRPVFTTVTENPNTIFVKGGLFGGSEQGLQRPFKEQWWRRAETWEKPHVPDENKIF